MTISSYSDLQTAVLNYLVRVNDTDAQTRVLEWIVLAEDELRMDMAKLMLTAGETNDTAFSIGSEYVALPTGFIRARSIRINGNTTRALNYLPPQVMERRTDLTSSSAEPFFYTIQGGQLRFLAAPDTTYTATFAYYALAALTSPAPTNWLLLAHPKIYLRAVLTEAYEYYEDYDKAQVSRADVARLLAKVETTEGQGQAASALQMRPNGSTP